MDDSLTENIGKKTLGERRDDDFGGWALALGSGLSLLFA